MTHRHARSATRASERVSSGGGDDADSSGVLRFARVEYANDGLRLLGVGSATRVEYVQVNRARGNGLTINGGVVGALTLTAPDERFMEAPFARIWLDSLAA